MSATSSVVTAEHFAYVAARTRGDDAFLIELKESASKAGIPPIWVSPEQASFMQILLKVSGAEQVIEVGTLAGYSAITMARALPASGHVHTIELAEAHADFAEEWIARSDVADRVTVHRGRGVDVLPRLGTGTFDACFLDADKSSYPAYLEESLRLLRPGGLVMVDNAFAFGQLLDDAPTDREVPAVRAFNDSVPKIAGLQAVIVPMGDGVWVGAKDR